jgi:mannose-6-phosphate isomerase-like protein (cupin superfamily)
MTPINLDSIVNAKKNNIIYLHKNAFKNILTWKDFYNIFKESYSHNQTNFGSFATVTIDTSERYTNLYDSFIDYISTIHPGKKIGAMSIIHFITRNDNSLLDEDGQKFMNDFLKLNPNKVPSPLPPKEDFAPTIHSDPVDGFFIQFQGSTLWKIYYDSITEEYILNSGDMIFIPKKINHSVESLCPRNAVSISFTD